jgi:hypothetical protein
MNKATARAEHHNGPSTILGQELYSFPSLFIRSIENWMYLLLFYAAVSFLTVIWLRM